MANSTTAVQAVPGLKPLKSFSNLLPVLALLIFGILFVRHIGAIEHAEIDKALASLSIWQCTAALGLTALSFRALGHYDVLVHRVLHTGQSAHATRKAGVKVIALSQTLGFGAVTGALVS